MEKDPKNYYTVALLKSTAGHSKTSLIQGGYYANDARAAAKEFLMDDTYNFPIGTYELKVTSGSLKQVHNYTADKAEVKEVKITIR